ncbi:hypothetical protein SVAN01_01077 [Stagonosporopsis vannaccii]|nr:hypothetical protein SVAN01_01077 [Stagonosporopsis vannaccii]
MLTPSHLLRPMGVTFSTTSPYLIRPTPAVQARSGPSLPAKPPPERPLLDRADNGDSDRAVNDTRSVTSRRRGGDDRPLAIRGLAGGWDSMDSIRAREWSTRRLAQRERVVLALVRGLR